MREQLIEGDDSVTIDAPERVSFGQHVRQAGEDIAKGAVALTAGTRLDAASMGLIAESRSPAPEFTIPIASP